MRKNKKGKMGRTCSPPEEGVNEFPILSIPTIDEVRKINACSEKSRENARRNKRETSILSGLIGRHSNIKGFVRWANDHIEGKYVVKNSKLVKIEDVQSDVQEKGKE